MVWCAWSTAFEKRIVNELTMMYLIWNRSFITQNYNTVISARKNKNKLQLQEKTWDLGWSKKPMIIVSRLTDQKALISAMPMWWMKCQMPFSLWSSEPETSATICSVIWLEVPESFCSDLCWRADVPTAFYAASDAFWCRLCLSPATQSADRSSLQDCRSFAKQAGLDTVQPYNEEFENRNWFSFETIMPMRWWTLWNAERGILWQQERMEQAGRPRQAWFLLNILQSQYEEKNNLLAPGEGNLIFWLLSCNILRGIMTEDF